MKKLCNVISVGYGRQLFSAGNAERQRMEQCAAALEGSLHMVIFTRHTDDLSETIGAHGLVLHPTQSRYTFLMVFDAIRVVRRIIMSDAAAASPLPHVTTQDPFEAGAVGYVAKLLHGVTLTVQEHADVFSTLHWRRESVGNWLRYWIGLYILRRADVVRVVAARTIPPMRALGVTAPIRQLPVAIDAGQFKAVRQQASDTHQLFTYLTVARFVPQKNLPLLVQAFAAAYREEPRLRLCLVGDGTELRRVRAENAAQFPPATTPEPPITIQPWSDSVPALMQQADAYILSSNYEGWGRVLIEAMVAGLPIVTTDVGCAGEVVQSGAHGIVVPVDNKTALTAALLRLVTDVDFYTHVRANVAALDVASLPGTDLATYGDRWVATLIDA